MEAVVPDLYRLELGGVNAYLWTGRGGPTLIDTGYPWSVAQIETDLRSQGIEPGDLERIILTRPLNLLIHRRYRPGCERVDELVIEGHVTPEGFTVLHTPGHAPGHISLHHADAGLLITGDAISHRGGRLGLPPSLFTPNMPLAIESLQKFLKPDYQVACFGHGPPLKEQARERIESFVKSLQPS